MKELNRLFYCAVIFMFELYRLWNGKCHPWPQEGICIALDYYIKLGKKVFSGGEEKKEWKLVDKLDIPLLQVQKVQTLVGLTTAVLLYLQSFQCSGCFQHWDTWLQKFLFDLQ